MERIGDIDPNRELGNEKRTLRQIAKEINADWGYRVNFAAAPYLQAMEKLDSIDDMYFQDTADSIVRYFLANATSWKGPKARAVKKELNDMLKKRG